MGQPTNGSVAVPGQNPLKPPPRIWSVREHPYEGYKPPQPDGYHQSSRIEHGACAIVIDNGSSTTRAGWSFDQNPRFTLPPTMARYRDRKVNKSYAFIGSDAYVDATTRGQMKNAFEGGSGIVSNWDAMEGVLDYIFLKLGVNGEGGVGRPIVMTEPVANMGYSRKTMTEIMFECYSAPSLAYGIDSLFSYNHNGGKDGLVVSSSYSSTHLIPVLDSKAVLSHATRLNWGRSQSADYLLKLLRLKYPTFPGKLTETQAEEMVREHCYVSKSYEEELSGYLDWTGLEDRDHVIQYPFTEQVVIQKSEEELAKIAEKRREGGRRLQEQAAKMRLEKLIRKEQELDYYRELQQRGSTETKKEFKRLLDSEDFKDEAELDRRIKELDKSIRKARTKDIGGVEEEEDTEPPTFPLLDIPDADLDEAGLKQKRHQRLMKSNVDARARAKIEKAANKARIAEEERLDTERRENDLESWLEERREARNTLLQKMKDRERLKADLGNRKSLASQMRMKSIANLASDNPTKKRRRGNDEDTFGANDDDWGVYRTIATGDQSDDDEEEDANAGLKNLEAQLLRYDPNFSEQNTLDAQSDWTKSLVHSFLRGPWPFDPESQREIHQVHLNVERIRVPEVVFQPSIAGLEQAGIVEIAANIITQRLADDSQRDRVLKDVFLTGGNTLFQGFEERLQKELRAVLPAESPFSTRGAKDPVLDAWKGAARWAEGDGLKRSAVTRQEYLEKGGEYLKEHNLGNASVI
ncbi:MAG: Nuclear actin-protein involved in chromatin remodeling [Pycnora praestabilis]|nr:MAG: Nuclear actin-protein involved in chromatin remodeling [Pycnora praestabilis]